MQRFGGRLLEVVAYESRTARVKLFLGMQPRMELYIYSKKKWKFALFFRQPRMEWYIYSKKNNESLLSPANYYWYFYW